MSVFLNAKQSTVYQRRSKEHASSKRTSKRKKKFVPMERTKVPVRRDGSDTSSIPSHGIRPPKEDKSMTILSPELQERELRAQQEIERKKKCVAPLYNKGGYQYVATAEQAKDVGR